MTFKNDIISILFYITLLSIISFILIYICYYFIYLCLLCKSYIFNDDKNDIIEYNFGETRTHYELDDYL